VQKFDDFKVLCADVLEAAPRVLTQTRPTWIFGAGNFGRDLASVLIDCGYTIAGFVETEPRFDELMGLPVHALRDVGETDRGAQLAVGIFNRAMPFSGLERAAKDAGFQDIFLPYHLYAQFGSSLGWRFWLSSPSLIANSLEAIERVYVRLSDEASRQCLLNILSFRMGRLLDYADFMHPEAQYFNELTLSGLTGRPVSYVDGGAYTGDSYAELAERVDVETAYLFEPDPDNFCSLVSNVRTAGRQAVCLPCALSDSYSVLSFTGGAGEGAAISEEGGQRIVTAALDDVFPNHQIDMIKLDVEGAEIPALRGATALIRRSRPVMAISLYHKPDDAWVIPLLVGDLCGDYAFYIRQHYYNSFDSVYYAVPR
jgi:FkbM family methyltransferase